MFAVEGWTFLLSTSDTKRRLRTMSLLKAGEDTTVLALLEHVGTAPEPVVEYPKTLDFQQQSKYVKMIQHDMAEVGLVRSMRC